jgi:hypothetical protein
LAAIAREQEALRRVARGGSASEIQAPHRLTVRKHDPTANRNFCDGLLEFAQPTALADETIVVCYDNATPCICPRAYAGWSAATTLDIVDAWR